MANLKGHATIELTDVKTGKKEVVEHDNLITKATEKLIMDLMSIYGVATVNSYFLPLISKAMGGVYIFSNTLTENVNNIALPDAANAALTGYAGDSISDGNDNKRGDFNAEESGEIANGYKYVWDFGTNDANGEIAAIALTNNIAGFHGNHYSLYQAIHDSNQYSGNARNNYKGLGWAIGDYASQDIAAYSVELDSINGILTYIKKTSTTQIQIRKYKIETKNIGLKNKLGNLETISTENITIADSVQTEINEMIAFVDGHDGYYYGLSGRSNGNNYLLKISKLSKSTHEYTAATSHTLSNLMMPIFGEVITYMRYDRITPVIRNGYIYSFSGENSSGTTRTYSIVKISINDPTDFTILPNSNFTVQNAQYGTDNIIYYLNGNIITNGFLIDRNDELTPTNISMFYNQFSGSYTCAGRITTDGRFALCGSYSDASAYNHSYLLPVLQYLATINNLDTPVTKTAAKTMKITYTLTYANS